MLAKSLSSKFLRHAKDSGECRYVCHSRRNHLGLTVTFCDTLEDLAVTVCHGLSQYVALTVTGFLKLNLAICHSSTVYSPGSFLRKGAFMPEIEVGFMKRGVL